MITRPTFLAFVLAAVATYPLAAHEGHAHKLLGTVVSFDMVKKVLTVTDTDGKEVIVQCSDQTRYLKGAEAAHGFDLKEGMRVSVSYTETGEAKNATEVKLGVAAPPPAPAPAKD